MEYLVSALVGYLLGSVNPAYILGKLKGFDIRTKGSHNAGASNAKILIGWWAFFVVLVYDFGKAFLSIMLVRQLYPNVAGADMVAGACAIAGHIYPFYLNFKGGKGFASYIGFVFSISLLWGVIIAVLGLAAAFATNWIVSCTLVFVVGFPIVAVITHQPLIAIIAACFASFLIIYAHRINFKRIRTGEEIGINGKRVTLFLSKEAREKLGDTINDVVDVKK